MAFNASEISGIDVNMDLELIAFVIKTIQIFFLALGTVLKSMIIYFERFGRDTQKRSLFNRVSLLKWKITSLTQYRYLENWFHLDEIFVKII